MRPEFPEKDKVAAELRSLAKNNLAHLDAVIAAQPEVDPAFCAFYYRECLRFAFGAPEKAGFRKFGEECAKRNLLSAPPAALALV